MAPPKGGAIGLQNGTGAKGLNMKEPPPDPAAQGGANGTPRAMLYLVALPFNILEAIGHGGFHGAWHLLFVVGCAFRACSGRHHYAADGVGRLCRPKCRSFLRK